MASLGTSLHETPFRLMFELLVFNICLEAPLIRKKKNFYLY